jgi:hypothetical protein
VHAEFSSGENTLGDLDDDAKIMLKSILRSKVRGHDSARKVFGDINVIYRRIVNIQTILLPWVIF